MLQSRRVVRAEDLADRFEISIRTVYRDVRALQEGGIPICAEAGVGYYLVKGYNLPPVMFTNEEARALLLAGKIVEKISDEATTAHYSGALDKVRAVLNAEKKDELEGLEEKILVNPFPSGRPDIADLHLEKIKYALSANIVVELLYNSAGKGEETCRIVEPLGLLFYNHRWHLIAYCRMRSDYRDFRLDRIARFNILKESFQRFRHPSLKEYVNKLHAETELTDVVIKVQSSLLPFLGDIKYSMGLISEKSEGEWTEMNFAAFCLEYFSRWILTLGDKVEVVSPAELNETLKKNVSRLYLKYGSI
jgi:predicted DNA-binding transcriptional regulator YafY